MTIKNEKVKANVYEIDLDILVDVELTPNQIVLLNIIYNKAEVNFIKYSSIDREDIMRHDLYTLYKKDYLINENAERYKFKFSELLISDKGKSFINREEKAKDKKQIAFDEFMDKYYNLFPEKIYTGNLPVRSNLKTCKTKMMSFIKEHKYDYETILKATEIYIKRCRDSGWGYMKTAYYFIKKDNESILESYCEDVINNKNKTTEDAFSRDF